jgi:hypothetical protein
MRTPGGKECKYYYADYYRGRETQVCRLLAANPNGGRWKPSHCASCPVPDILRQNACPNLVLEGKIQKTLLGLREQVVVYAVCTHRLVEVENPAIGCGECHLHRPGTQILK